MASTDSRLMRAFEVSAFDSAPTLIEQAIPTPAKGEVLLQIQACGLNFADLLMAQGKYQDTPKPPFTLGMEVCGIVTAAGPGTPSPAIGSRVAVFGGKGGFADYGLFPADLCQSVPDAMPAEAAAGFQVAYGTSHLALTRRARLQAGETLLVLGAAGGVGLTAVEIGKALGARVIAVARGAEKLRIAQEAGADHVIEAGEDLRDRVMALGGADVVYDPVGGDLGTAALRATRREARYLVVGFASGDVPPFPANHLLVKNVDLIGFYWGGYLKFAPDALLASMAELMDWYASGKLRPHVSHVVPLAEAGAALELLRTRKSTGKVVVTP